MAHCEQDFYLSIREINNKTELTNKGILSFFEDIGGYQSDLAGFGLKQIEQTRISWVLLHWKVKVLKRIKYDGKPIKVRTWSRGMKRACCYRDYEIYNSKGELCVIGSSKWALIHLDNGLMRLSEDILNKYATDNKCVFGDDFDFLKIREPENYSYEYSYTITRRDLDINGHMHNLNYLDLAYEALPEAVYNNHCFDNFEIMYKKEAKLGDKLKCLYSNNRNEHIITIKSEDEKTLHAIVKFAH